MDEAEALDVVRRVISGTVIHLRSGGHDTVGNQNADTIIHALHSAGWSWVQRSPNAWDELRTTGRTVVDYPKEGV